MKSPLLFFTLGAALVAATVAFGAPQNPACQNVFNRNIAMEQKINPSAHYPMTIVETLDRPVSNWRCLPFSKVDKSIASRRYDAWENELLQCAPERCSK